MIQTTFAIAFPKQRGGESGLLGKSARVLSYVLVGYQQFPGQQYQQLLLGRDFLQLLQKSH